MAKHSLPIALRNLSALNVAEDVCVEDRNRAHVIVALWGRCSGHLQKVVEMKNSTRLRAVLHPAPQVTVVRDEMNRRIGEVVEQLAVEPVGSSLSEDAMRVRCQSIPEKFVVPP